MEQTNEAKSERSGRRGVGLALLSVLFAAVFLLAFRSATRSAPRAAVVLAMLAVSALLNGLFVIARRRGTRSRLTRVTVIATLVLGGLSITGNVGVAGALEHLDPGLTSTLLQTQVFVVGAAGALFLRERITVGMVVGALFAVGGFVVLSLDGWSSADAARRADPVGVAFALLASVSFGAMLVYTRSVIDRIEPVVVNVARLVLAVAALSVVVVPSGALGEIDAPTWLMVALAAACGPFISRLCLMFALRHIEASRTKLITLLTPAAAFALEIALLGTDPGVLELVGAGAILLGVALPTALARRGR